MADFNKFWGTLLKHEGGFVNHPDDRGGPTNKGIILANWQRWGRDIDHDGDIDVDDLKFITDRDAYDIYKKHFWDKIQGDKIASQPLAEILFDMYVNAPYVAGRMLQQLINVLNPNKVKLKIDGAIGNATVAAMNFTPASTLHDEYKELRKTYYNYRANLLPSSNGWYTFFKSIGVASVSSQQAFIKGWLARVETFPDLKKKSIAGGAALIVGGIALYLFIQAKK